MSILRLLTQLGRRLSRGDTTTPQRQMPTVDEPATRPPEVPEAFKKEVIIPERIEPILETTDKARNDVLQNPLSFGGQSRDFGSALYDFVALSPLKNTPRKASEWASELYNTKKRKEFSHPMLSNVAKQTISLDEISDVGLANFDRQGNLVGGFLKHADEFRVDVKRDDLLSIIKRGPGSNLKNTDFAPIAGMSKRVDKLIDTTQKINNQAKDVFKKFLKADAPDKTRIQTRLKMNDQRIEEFRSRNIGVHGVGTLRELLREIDDIEDSLMSLSRYDESFSGNNSLIPNQTAQLLRNQSANVRKQVDLSRRRAKQLKDMDGKEYGVEYPDYILGGGEEYGEAVVSSSLAKDVIPGKKYYSANHYRDLHNPVVFYRYSIRSLKDNPEKKVMTLEEVQADLSKSNRAKASVEQTLENTSYQELNLKSNPYSVDAMLSVERDIYKKNLDEIQRLFAKGSRRTPEDTQSIKKLDQRNKALENSTLRKQEADIKNADFTYGPLQRDEDYALIAVKHAIKQAIKRGDVSHVVVNPADGHHALVRANSKFNHVFYGNSSGKQGKIAKDKNTKDTFKKQQEFARYKKNEFEKVLKNPQADLTKEQRLDYERTLRQIDEFLKQKDPSFLTNTKSPKVYEQPGESFVNPKGTSIMAKAFQTIGKNFNLQENVGTFEVAKSNPKKQFKILFDVDPDGEGRKILNSQLAEKLSPDEITKLKAQKVKKIPESKEVGLDLLTQHEGAFETLKAADLALKRIVSRRGADYRIEQVMDIDPSNYYKAYGIKIDQIMDAMPFKIYKSKGGLVVDTNKW